MTEPVQPKPRSQVPLDATVFTVSELNAAAGAALEDVLGTQWVTGELSNLARPASGHLYFSLKDAAAQVRCAMFRGSNRSLRFVPRDGLQVVLRGRASVYAARGDYQLIVDHMEPAGEGLLRRQFEALKARLSAEGLFAASAKAPLPALPRRIGLITSPSGAAVRDMLQILGRRFPAVPVIIYPVQVQGEQAKHDLVRALATAAERSECDVLIVGRGGGSLEDLWAFNEEIVARAIHACPIPVVSAVGHETDFTIADLVADLRAPTPSGAAELIVPDRRTWLDRIGSLATRAGRAVTRTLQRRIERWQELDGRLRRRNPSLLLEQYAQRLDELGVRALRALQQGFRERRLRLHRAATELRAASPLATIRAARQHVASLELQLAATMRAALGEQRRQLAVLSARLQSASPLNTLQRGYALVETRQGQLIRTTRDLTEQQEIVGRLADGRFLATVKKVLPD